MNTEFFSLIISAIFGGVIAYLIAIIRFQSKITFLKKQSVRQSRSTILGEVTEKLSPLLPEFPYHTKDIVFLGKGVDYIVFDGLSNGKLKEIVLLEIKSGKSQLNKNEQLIRDYLAHYPVRYEILRIQY